MSDQEPTELMILLRIVEVLERRMLREDRTIPDDPTAGHISNIVNNFIASSNYVETSGGAIMRDQYNVNQAGAVGPGSTAHHISFTQTWKESNVDLPALKEELATLRAAMRKEAIEPAHDMAVAEIASAEMAAEKGDGPSVLEHLAKAGRWALGVAIAIGAALAAEVIKKAIGV
jgi:hypothetical protein